MKNLKILLFFISFLFLAATAFSQNAQIDKPAPDFFLSDSHGKTVKLSDYLGKYVVLEWVNYGCPFVKKHYKNGNMQMLQTKYREAGVIWLTICSSAPGKQGYLAGEKLNAEIEGMKSEQSAYLVDSDGKVGLLYGAKTTPHMFVINPAGILIYAGGIDDIRSTDVEDIKKAKYYIRLVLDAVLAGKETPVKISAPYGCSVKYED